MNSVWNAAVPVTLLLDRGGECNEVAIAPTTSDELQRNWQTAIVKTDRKHYCWQPQHVDEAAITTEIVQAPAAEVWRGRINVAVARRADWHNGEDGRIR